MQLLTNHVPWLNGGELVYKVFIGRLLTYLPTYLLTYLPNTAHFMGCLSSRNRLPNFLSLDTQYVERGQLKRARNCT